MFHRQQLRVLRATHDELTSGARGHVDACAHRRRPLPADPAPDGSAPTGGSVSARRLGGGAVCRATASRVHQVHRPGGDARRQSFRRCRHLLRQRGTTHRAVHPGNVRRHVLPAARRNRLPLRQGRL